MKKTKCLCSIFAIFFIWQISLPTYAQAKKKDELARVAILNFINISKDTKYAWVVKSLPDAINKAMFEHFEFIRTTPQKAQDVADRVRGKSARYSKKNIERIAIRSKSEIVIYGEFYYDKKAAKIDVVARIYHLEGHKLIGKVHLKSEIDKRLFAQIDVIAQQIVKHIYRFALEVDTEEAKKEKLRILVLVPSWTTEREKKRAEKELSLMKGHLTRKYDAKFLTLFFV